MFSSHINAKHVFVVFFYKKYVTVGSDQSTELDFAFEVLLSQK